MCIMEAFDLYGKKVKGKLMIIGGAEDKKGMYYSEKLLNLLAARCKYSNNDSGKRVSRKNRG